MKKASCLAADIMRHGRKAKTEMTPLTDSTTFGSTWSEQGKEGTSSSTEAVLPEEKRRSRRDAEPEQQQQRPQRQRRSRRSSSQSSLERVLDDSEHSVTSVRGASPKPRRQQWSAMFFVHMSLVVVSLAVAATIALVFTLRDTEVQNIDIAELSDGNDVAIVAGENATDHNVIHISDAGVKESEPPASHEVDTASVGGGRVRLSPSSVRNIKEPRPPMPEQISSADSSAVLVLQDGTFGNVRQDVPPLMPSPGPASEMDVERRRERSMPPDGLTTPEPLKVANGPQSSLSVGDEDKVAQTKLGRGLKRLDRKAVVRSRGIQGLMNG
ncbi:hypothetical protein MRX96_043940 [Rhipicephalus microplus]